MGERGMGLACGEDPVRGAKQAGYLLRNTVLLGVIRSFARSLARQTYSIAIARGFVVHISVCLFMLVCVCVCVCVCVGCLAV